MRWEYKTIKIKRSSFWGVMITPAELNEHLNRG